MEKYSKFIDEIFTSPVIASQTALEKYLPYLKAIREGKVLLLNAKPKLQASFFDQLQNIISPDQESNDDNVCVIPVNGLITRYGSWFDYGAEDYVNMADEAFANPAVKAIVFRIDSEGGSVASMIPFKDLMARKEKPCIAAVDSSAMSVAYYLAAGADKIFAVDDMATVGSIGVMATITDTSKMYDQFGIKSIDIYPPESSYKNLDYRNALKGDNKLLIDEVLTPLAKTFQDYVRAQRKNLNESIPGTLEGRSFWAGYGTENGLAAGLIDGVKSFNDILDFAFNYQTNSQAKKLFN